MSRKNKAPIAGRKTLCISEELAQRLHLSTVITSEDVYKHFSPPITLGQSEEVRTVMDSCLSGGFYDTLSASLMSDGMGLAGYTRFIGYPALSNLAQEGLIQAGVETTADEMTRKWVEVKHGGDASSADPQEKVKAITEALRNYHVQARFREATMKIGYFGGCLMFIDTGKDDAALKLPLVLDERTFQKGSLKGLRIVEPVCISPGQYNATNPLSPNFFKPTSWYIYGKEVHASHFLYFTSETPPILLRPSYNFFGIPKAQIALDYVANFTESREAAARLLKKFSLTALKTNMSAIFSGGGTGDIDRRMMYFAQTRSNDGVLLVDMESEDIVKLETPLSGVTDIVRQSLELLSAVFRIPSVKLLGISPGGMNATGESDMRSFWDYTAGQQEKQLTTNMETLLQILCLNEFGYRDDALTFDWIELGDEDEEKKATTQRIEAERDAIYLDRGVVSGDEVREKLAADEQSGYAIVTDGISEAPDDMGGEGLPGVDLTPSNDPTPSVDTGEEKAADTSLNGAQVTSMVDIVSQVAQGTIPRESGIAILTVAFPIDRAKAEEIIGTAGNGFTPAVKETGSMV